MNYEPMMATLKVTEKCHSRTKGDICAFQGTVHFGTDNRAKRFFEQSTHKYYIHHCTNLMSLFFQEENRKFIVFLCV